MKGSSRSRWRRISDVVAIVVLVVFPAMTLEGFLDAQAYRTADLASVLVFALGMAGWGMLLHNVAVTWRLDSVRDLHGRADKRLENLVELEELFASYFSVVKDQHKDPWLRRHLRDNMLDGNEDGTIEMPARVFLDEVEQLVVEYAAKSLSCGSRGC